MRQNDSASRTVVSREEILKYGDSSVLDAMKRLPGLTVADGSVRMRGLGNGYTQLLVNGERPPAGFSLESVAPESIERVEILRAATAEYSTQSIAGTVNIVLKRAVTKASQEWKANVGGRPGAHSGGFNYLRSDKDGGFSYTAGVTLNLNDAHLDSLGIDDAHDADDKLTEQRVTTTRRHNQFAGLNMNANLGWKMASGNSLNWQSFAIVNQSRGTSEELTQTVLGPRFPYPRLDVEFTGGYRSLRSDLAAAVRLAEGHKLDTKLGLSLAQFDRAMGREAVRGQAAVLARQYDSDVRDHGISWTGKYAVNIVTAHALSFGWDLKHNEYRQHDVQTDAALDNVPTFNYDNQLSAGITRLAAYVQDEWDVSKNLSLYLGARWESMRTRADGAGYEPTTVRANIPSPVLQTLWKIPGTKGDQLRLALTRTFRAPELSRLVRGHFYTSYNTAVSPDFIGNPALRPEVADGLDLAYEHYWGEGALFSLSATARNIDQLTRDAIRFDGVRWVSQQVNEGSATVRGLEMETKFPLKSLFEGAPAVNLRANVSRNWSQVSSAPGPDNRLARQPEWSASLGADFKRGQFSGGASFAFVSGGWVRNSVFESKYASIQRDLDAYLVYKLGAASQLRLSVQNLLRTDGTEIGRYQNQNGRQDSAVFTPGLAGWRLQYERKL